jgi:hypothetical protein
MAELPEGGDIGLGLTAFEAGLLMAPGGLMMLVAVPVAGSARCAAADRRPGG